jgi:hypothetical protein
MASIFRTSHLPQWREWSLKRYALIQEKDLYGIIKLRISGRDHLDYFDGS